MIFVTGDTHSDVFSRLNTDNFPQQKTLTKNDYVIICGDFGVIWDKEESRQEKHVLKWLEDKPFTTLFVDGNHENFNRLEQYKVREWNGGKVHKIRPSIIHLMRGQVYTIDDHKFFAFGGARSQDIVDGVLEPDDPLLKKWKNDGADVSKMFRINNISWWKQEMPSEIEMQEGLDNLQRHNYKVDYVITHDMPTSNLMLYASIYGRDYTPDALNNYLEKVRTQLNYTHWYCGHHHDNCGLTEKDTILFQDIRQVIFN